MYMTLYAVEGIKWEDRWAFTLEIFLRFNILIIGFIFIYYELVSVFRDGTDYFRDVFNYIDFMIPILNWILIITTVFAHAERDEGKSSD